MFRPFLLPGVLLVSLIAPAQQTGSPVTPAPTLKVTTHLVYVDVLVRDEGGRIVRGLTEQDFRVSEDGHPQTIQFFEAHDTATAASLATAPSPTTFSNVNAGSETRPMTILLFDLLNTPTDDQLSARQQMLRFLGALPAGDHVVLFTQTDQLQMVQGVTGSPALLAAASRMLRPRNVGLDDSRAESAEDRQIATNAGAQFGGLAPTAMRNGESVTDAVSYQVRARSTIDALGKLAESLNGYPGRKSLYWLAESFPLSVDVIGMPANTAVGGDAGLGSGAGLNSPDTIASAGPARQTNKALMDAQGHFSQTSRQEMQKTLNELASARIAVYPTSVFGLATRSPDAEMSGAVELSPNPGDPRGGFFTMANLKGEMNDLARATGGEAIFGTNDVAGAMRRTMDESASYYTLAYVPTNNQWNGQFRAIRVEAAGESSLIYRRGYFATPDGAATDFHEDFQRAMQPDVPEESGLRLETRMLPPDPRNPGLQFISTIDTADVDFDTRPNGHRTAKLYVQLIAFSDSDRQPKDLPQTSGTLNIDLDPQRCAFILKARIAFPQQLRLRPGQYRLLLGVYDRNSHRLGTLEMPVTVPAE